MAVRYQLAHYARLAQRELKQPSDSIDPASSRTRHTVKRVRHAAHAMVERGACVFIPGIAVSAANADSMHVKTLDRFERSRQFGRNRDASDHVRVLKQLLRTNR